MAIIYAWPRHVRHNCPDAATSDRCLSGLCPFCGGLFACTVCKGVEAELTTTCCGRPLTDGEAHEIEQGCLNFRDGKWRPESNLWLKERDG
jgi:hypothetical protein